MPARRYRSLHFNLQDGQNVVFHREHRSKKNRSAFKPGKLQKFKREDRRKWKTKLRQEEYLKDLSKKKRKRKRY